MQHEWYDERKRRVKESVQVHDLLRGIGVSLRHEDRPEQISCPFHGQDDDPSARVFPSTPDEPSHLWCYVCMENWDVIGLQMRITGQTFSEALAALESGYSVERPALDGFSAKPKDTRKSEFEEVTSRIDGRLRVLSLERDPTWVAQANIAFDRVLASRQKLEHSRVMAALRLLQEKLR